MDSKEGRLCKRVCRFVGQKQKSHEKPGSRSVSFLIMIGPSALPFVDPIICPDYDFVSCPSLDEDASLAIGSYNRSIVLVDEFYSVQLVVHAR